MVAVEPVVVARPVVVVMVAEAVEIAAMAVWVTAAAVALTPCADACGFPRRKHAKFPSPPINV
jgi:hypothetical protein